MIRKFFVLLMCSILIGITGCGRKPSGISQEIYDDAIYVINVTDSFLDGSSTAGETDQKLEKIDIDIDWESDDMPIQASITSIQSLFSSISLEYGSDPTVTEIKEARDKLADEINYKE